VKIDIPLGALLAAEHAYANLAPNQRRDASLVAELLLQAAAPFMGSVSRQLGRARITPEASRDLFQAYLRGASYARLADFYGVSQQTIGTHYRRRLSAALVRHRDGTPVAHLAREFGCSPAALTAEFEKETIREQTNPSAQTAHLPMRGDDRDGSLDGGHQRVDAGRRRSRSGGRPARSGLPAGIHDSAAA